MLQNVASKLSRGIYFYLVYIYIYIYIYRERERENKRGGVREKDKDKERYRKISGDSKGRYFGTQPKSYSLKSIRKQ